ncbi:MAG: D-glycero-beta-D-manno-heptose 1-phosphate adenylyltransferase [Bacteroidales bacterium]|jgi:rfaE bifunctional protein nucleotidyltransferase chain/domain|nr:D-glycero-beta-D-manno-heptose 1-phosphate adenylyltransferase [Bacteroidales bacterium]
MDDLKNKILTFALAKESPEIFRNQKVVFTNGCFDILHLGHVEYLLKAKSLGDILVVGLNSDVSVKRLKGDNRPIHPEHARAMVLAALLFVDYVIIFEEDTPYNLIRYIAPDVLVKGGDYRAEDVVGADIMKTNGGKVVIIPLTEGFSTTRVLQKAKISEL